MLVISDYFLLHQLMAMMVHVNDLFNYFKLLICKGDPLNFEFNCYYYHHQNFITLEIFLYCLHFLKLKLNLILSFYLPQIFMKMTLNLNYLLMDLLKNSIIIFKNFLVSYLFKLKVAFNSGHLFNFIKSNLAFNLIFIFEYSFAASLQAREVIKRQQQRKHHFWNLFCRMILDLNLRQPPLYLLNFYWSYLDYPVLMQVNQQVNNQPFNIY